MPATSIDGLVLVDKPAGITSFDVVRQVGRALGTKRLGHTGTLDPFATGLLVILTGRATRLIRFVPVEPKVYLADITFGSERDTDDVTGRVTREAEPPDLRAIEQALPSLTGALSQLPPAYSAKKVGGRRAYALARRGEEVTLTPAAVHVAGWEMLGLSGSTLRARITCGSGTYIRALARDLGRSCESAAHLSALRRECIGPWGVDDAISWNDVEAREVVVRPVRDALTHLPAVVLEPNDVQRLRHGQALPAHGAADANAIVLQDASGEVVAVGRREGGALRPTVVLADA